MDRPTGAVAAGTLGVAVLVASGVVLGTGADDGSSAGTGADTAAGTPASTPSPTARTPARAGTPPLLLPNLRSVEVGQLQVERTEGGRRLRFSASLGNLGPGPLVMRPRRRAGECPQGQLQAVQLLHEDRNRNGRFDRGVDRVGERRPVGCMLDHPDHDHWHFDAMAAYSLRRPDRDRPRVSRDKVSFCLRDNERVPGVRGTRREWFGECSRSGLQGISPGWVDVYDASLAGQTLRLPPTADRGMWCLDLEADPKNRVEETREDDNGHSVGIRIDGTRVRRAASERCR